MSALGHGLSHQAVGGIWRGIWLTRKGWDMGCEKRVQARTGGEREGTDAFSDPNPRSYDCERDADEEP